MSNQDQQQLCTILLQSLDGSNNQRRDQAEQQLKQIKAQNESEFCINLMHIIADSQTDQQY